MEKVNPTTLRLTVRLLHCLQKERGLTEMVDKQDKTKNTCMGDFFIESLELNRKSTDSAFGRFTAHVGNSSSLQSLIMKIRRIFEENQRVYNKTNFDEHQNKNKLVKRKILRHFNNLINQIIHEQFEISYAMYLKRTKRKTSSQNKIFDGLFPTIQKSPDSFEFMTPAERSFLFQQPSSWTPMVPERLDLLKPIDMSIWDMKDKIELPKLNNISLTQPSSGPTSTEEKINGDIGGTSSGGIGQLLESYETKLKEKAPESDDSNLVASMISLLFAFVKLKESKGRERCTLPTILLLADTCCDDLATSSHSDDTDTTENPKHHEEKEQMKSNGENERISLETQELRMLVNNLVLEIEKQRSLQQDVIKKAKKVEKFFGGPEYTSILNLCEESLAMSPELSKIQDLVKITFDFKAFKKAISLSEFWRLITGYMDKLHCIELHIIEEIEAKVDDFVMSRSKASINPVAKNSIEKNPNEAIQLLLSSLNSSSTRRCSTKSEALDLIRSIPPENMKSCFMTLIQNNFMNDRFDTSINKKNEERRESETLLENTSEVMAKQKWEVNLHEVKFEKCIARGGAGTTYLGFWRGQDVAIKVAAMTEMGIEGWNAEVESLQQLNHTNIIRLLGSISSPPPQPTRCLILEYCDAGNLEDAIKKETPSNFFYHVAKSMANGLSYLHDRGIFHRDIKPENVLLHGYVRSGKFVVKLTDFGLSTRFESMDKGEHSAETGTYRWMAPEVIRHEAYSYQADIYSYSLVVWQLLTHEQPFSRSSQIDAAQLVAMYEARPPFPDGTPIEIQTLISKGWSEDPQCRPSAEMLCTSLVKIMNELTSQENEWLASPHGHQVYGKNTLREENRVTKIIRRKSANSRKLVTPKSQQNTAKRKFQVKMGIFGKK